MKPDISIVEQEFEFQKKEWKVHRVGWILMGIFLAAGLTGLWGEGPLSEKKAGNEIFNLEYKKFTRVQKDFLMTLNVTSEQPLTQVIFTSEYFKKMEVRDIIPEPVSMKATEGYLILDFNLSKNGTILFYIDPIQTGNQYLELTVNGKTEKIHQYIYF